MPDLLTIDNNGKIWAFALHVDPDYTPDFILRQEIECNDRSSITQHSGGHFNFPEPYPYNGWRHEYETYTTYESSAIPILGTAYSNTPMQFSLDYQYFLDKEELDHNDIRSYFYGVKHDAPSSPEPTTLTYLSLVDNRCGNPLEIVEVTATNPVNMSDVSGYAYYWIGIDYPKLDENYSVNFTIDEQMYCHCVSEITDGATLEISGNTQLLFYDGEIIVNEGCTLDLNNASVIAKSGANKITVYGELIMDGNPMIQCDGGSFEIEYKTSFPLNTHYISGGRFYGQDLYTFLITGDGDNLIVGDENESCIFRKTKFNYSGDLTIQNLSNQSENIEITFSEGDLLIQNNTGLKNTFISASKPESDDNRITIQNNVFNNINETYNDYIIGIDDYTIYSIDENEINNGYCNAIGLYHAGNLVDEDINISNNVINNTSNPGTNRAVEVFFSKAEIFDNYIANNEYGIVAFGKSKSRIYGDMSAPTRYETQQFIENSIHCYFSYSSYPSKIRYNYFESQSTSDPYIKLVYYDIEDPGNPIPDPDQINSSTVYNIECNSWYSTFDPETQLIPLGSYDYDPYWYPGQYCTKDQTAAELVYDQAMLEIDSGNYVQADSMLKSVVSTYPTDPYSIQSLRELYALQGVLGNDYTGLRSYYLSVVSLNQDSLLCRSADWLGMHCLIKTGYNQEAIDWLDSTISVPKNTVDSIFAIINLGYIYTHFPDSSYKSGLITNYPGCIPTNYSNYRKDREHLVYELLKITGTDKPENPTLDAKVGSILSVSPNPSEGGSLKVNIETHTTGNSKLIIYNIQGMTVEEIDLGILEDTFVEKQIQLNHIPPGVYFISFIVNGVKADTKKVVVL